MIVSLMTFVYLQCGLSGTWLGKKMGDRMSMGKHRLFQKMTDILQLSYSELCWKSRRIGDFSEFDRGGKIQKGKYEADGGLFRLLSRVEF